jgi:Flp pilus assembly protein CpaB
VTYRLRNIVLAVGLAALAAALTSFYVANYKRSVQDGEKDVTIFVAARDIPVGTSGADAVARGMLREEQVARKSVVPGAISSPDEIGKKIATERVYAGEQVSARRFVPSQQRGIRAELKGNQRAFQVPGDVNQLLVGTLKAGDRVDVVGSIKFKVNDFSSGEGNDRDRVASRVVLRDLLVLRAPGGSLAAEKVGSTVDDYAVQLEVTDSQAQKLFYVMKNGDWSLQLRPAVDSADSPESVETIESVLGDGLKPRQFAQLYGGRSGQ